ncbi:recombinase family protein [Dyadobacter sp. CY356]|uniref:recombinase family protein n=1 Tax=Dyadobacter sp. CY356 TaxID=2906442 RepID=UPI001F337DFF|nr:recombinase family protein [Dyadobacter sp. CY356]MCF0059845.1 recombinase family protein [Dyadobacter sp. CY356]
MEIGYARVSTHEQNLDLQMDAFSKVGIQKIFTDKVSGVKAEKPNLNELLNYARSGDTVVVWRLDRLGRTTVQLIQFIEELSRQGINLRSLTEPIDTSTATGTMIVQIFCVLAEHERNVLRERTKAGLTAARARGRKGGKPKGLSDKFNSIKNLVKISYDNGEPTKKILKAFNIGSRSTLYRILRETDTKTGTFTKRK